MVERTGAAFVHPYNDERIIAGQGTAALELLTDHPDLDLVMTPVGGGGLLSGTAIATRALAPQAPGDRRRTGRRRRCRAQPGRRAHHPV